MVRALVASTHPGPSFAVAALAGILAWGFQVPWQVALVVVVSVLMNQFSVGLSNDAIDLVRDRESGRIDKPLVRGDISPVSVWVAAAVLGVASLGVSWFVHPGVFVAQTIFLVAGWAYNLGLKATVFSALAYAVGFGALPAIVSFAATPALAPPWWVVVIGSGLGVAAHFGNVVPDRETDKAHGVTGLPQLLTAQTAAVSLSVLVVAMATVLVVGAGARLLVASVPAAAIATGLAIAGGTLALRRPASRAAFRASVGAALVLALGLATALVTGG